LVFKDQLTEITIVTLLTVLKGMDSLATQLEVSSVPASFGQQQQMWREPPPGGNAKAPPASQPAPNGKGEAQPLLGEQRPSRSCCCPF
jgi:hypothetical protein